MGEKKEGRDERQQSIKEGREERARAHQPILVPCLGIS